jgi:hypothetical protein
MAAVTALTMVGKMIVTASQTFTAATSMTILAHDMITGQVAMSAQAGMRVDAKVTTIYGPSLVDQIAALAGEDPALIGATGYLDDIFTSRLMSDSE